MDRETKFLVRFTFVMIAVVIYCLTNKDHTPKLNTIWLTWADDQTHGTVYYGYSSGHRPDSVLHIGGFRPFYQKSGETYDRFAIPTHIDSIVHVDYWDDYHGAKYENEHADLFLRSTESDLIQENFWAGGDMSGRRMHTVGYKYTGFKER
mgnify:CR=1 FL=1